MLHTFRLLALGTACTIFYAGLAGGAFTLEPRWFFVPAGALCVAAIPLTWYELWKWRAQRKKNELE